MSHVTTSTVPVPPTETVRQDDMVARSNQLASELTRLRDEEQLRRDREREEELARQRELAKFD